MDHDGIGPRDLRVAALRGLLIAHLGAALLVLVNLAQPLGPSPAMLGAAVLGGLTWGASVGVAALLELRGRLEARSAGRAARIGLSSWALAAAGALAALAEVVYAEAALSGESGWKVLAGEVSRLQLERALWLMGGGVALTGPFGMAGAAGLLEPARAQALLTRLLEAVALLGVVTLSVGFIVGPYAVLLVLPLVLGGSGLVAGTRIALACWGRLERMEAHLFRGDP